jgi:phosphoglycolate phosphatase-like HAD superfamily hydrolase
MGGVIFDLDQTLVNSSAAEALRKAGQWPQVYKLIPGFSVYPGIAEALQYLRDRRIPFSIVSTSPGTYCQKVMAHWGLKPSHLVAYHDVKYRKPNPESILKALGLMGCGARQCLSLGDRDIDIVASNAAGVRSVACTWGAADIPTLLASSPADVLHEPKGLIRLFEEFF